MKRIPYGKILIVDKDLNLAYILRKFLELKNFKVETRSDGYRGLNAAEENQYDLFIIDIRLPKADGISLLQKIREKGIATPAIMMTDDYSLEDEIECYRSGTNLFHKKPIEFRLLEVQVKSLIKNNYREIFEVGDLKIDLDGKRIYKNDELVILSKLEFDLLILFLKSNGRLYTREEIMRRVFFNNKDISIGAVDTLISRLRKKLGDLEGDYFIETVFKSGYRVNDYYLS